MARKTISRTPRKAEEEYIPESIFDSIGGPGYKPTPTQREAQGEKKGPTVEELLAKMGAMEERFNEQERARARESTMAPPVRQPVQIGNAPELSLDNLPDPVTDAKGYASELLKRGRDHDKAMQTWETARTKANTPEPMGDPDALWDDFTQEYGAYAEDDAKIRFAASEATKKLAKKRVDVTTYMYSHSDLFFKDIVKEYEAVFGKPDADDDEPTERSGEPNEQPRPRKRASSVDDGNDGRTDGIIGGAEASGVQTPAKPKPGDFIKDLQDLQRSSGYF